VERDEARETEADDVWSYVQNKEISGGLGFGMATDYNTRKILTLVLVKREFKGKNGIFLELKAFHKLFWHNNILYKRLEYI